MSLNPEVSLNSETSPAFLFSNPEPLILLVAPLFAMPEDDADEAADEDDGGEDEDEDEDEEEDEGDEDDEEDED